MNIQIENLSFSFDFFGKSSNPVLNEINLKIFAGEFLALVGASGSGKTTLMQHLTGLLKPKRGRILIDGKNIWEKGFDFNALRKKMGLVFQFPETQLFEESVFKDIAFGPRNMGFSEDEVFKAVADALADVGLDLQEFENRIPLHLSEGEKRRVAIAGVLAMKPEFLVLDEPTAGMDHGGVKAIKKNLQNYHSRGKTVLLISHNLDFVNALAERIVVLSSGTIIFDGHKSELFKNHKLLQTAGLSVPRTQVLLDKLKEQGLVPSTDLFDIIEIKKALLHNIPHQATQKTVPKNQG